MLMVLSLCALAAGAAPGGNGNGRGGGSDSGTRYQEELRVLWSVELQGAFSQVRPVVSADGKVYGVDVLDNLYVVTPDGTSSPPVVVVPGAGGKGLDLGPDGSVYTGDENLIKAFDPLGNEKWSFIESPRAHVLSDVAVGPDGNVYALASNGMGVFSLVDAGDHATLRWQNPEIYDKSNAEYTELAFGPANGGNQLYFRANQDTRGLTDDGRGVFRMALGAVTPVVSPLDGSVHLSDSAYDSSGNLLWQFAGFPAATGASKAAVGVDGVHYTVNQGSRVFAIDPLGRELWRTELDENVGAPDVDPNAIQLIMPTSAASTSPVALRALDAKGGGDLWRLELPPPATPAIGRQFVDTAMGFSPDGSTGYVITAAAGGRATLHAIALDPAIPDASTVLRSRDVSLRAKSRRNQIIFDGEVTVTDQNRAAISGAVVTATWTSSNGLALRQQATTGRGGVAKFDLSGPGGIYTLTVESIVKDPYVFDAEHSILSGSLARF
jgi:hypothetical protein